MTPTPPAETLTWQQRARAAFDKLPTRWLVTSVLGVLLALSALLGGLDDAPATPVPELDPGDAYTGTQLKISIDRAILIDAFPEQGVTPEIEGNRLLVISATVDNVWDSPVRIAGQPNDADSVVPVGVDGIDASAAPSDLLVIDDGTTFRAVQPGVPVELAYVWEVAPDALAAGDDITVDILDRLQRKGFIVYGDVFDDPFVAAHVDLVIEDVGAGAETEDGDEG
ncbi:hypothetical protein HD599_003373 [Conyzicola lurida]|uniref:DUF4352 domain-containing protein n=1 Tax=Conyzicola lurida TaxID=1172621 RepID=A0A841AM16_9MICO|nr:hypothetical protein [Conyzicola lurida]MBB5845050.1 hypothetical protein [Conyzicola lurida]